MRFRDLGARIARTSLCLGLTVTPLIAANQNASGQKGPFRRISSFLVFENTDVETESVAEIVASARNGKILVYTDSENENLGFVDITDPHNPAADGTVALGGEPTSVAVRGDYALVCINTSADFVNTSGDLLVVDIETRSIVRTLPLGGQPDAIAVSPNGRYAAIAIENERDEDLGDGEPPQLPAGFVVIVDLFSNNPMNWSTRVVDLVGVCDLFPEDPEPEFVDINDFNVAAVTCQENNHIILIWLPTGQIIHDFSAGTVDLQNVDTNENDLIQQQDSLDDVPREPDAITWITPFTLATADEGDLFGGSRGFTTWKFLGAPLFQPGNALEHLTARVGHYPEGRSENKGNEPEGIEYGRYGSKNYLFVGSERSSLVFVYRIFPAPFFGALFPKFQQILPTGVAPEGLLAIPERDLFVVACEDDARDDKIRSTIMIYERTNESNYPTIASKNRSKTGVPIPWGALSALACDPSDENTIYTVHDSFYRESRLFRVNRSKAPARITHECQILDSNNVLLDALNQLLAQLPGTPDFDPAAIVNADGTVNLDLEGIALGLEGEVWVASEGAGNLDNGISDAMDRPFETPNMLIRLTTVGGQKVIDQVVFPPIDVTRNQFRFGFEGVAATGNGGTQALYVCFQRAWQDAGDPADRARIGRYDLFSNSWSFAYYPLDAATSPNGGWVGLSEITHLDGDRFAVIERDNQGGPDATIKRIYEFSIAGVSFTDNANAGSFETLQKTLVSDLLAEGVFAPTGGLIPEKLEGLCALPNGSALIVNDNDGVDDNSGETLLVEVGDLFD